MATKKKRTTSRQSISSGRPRSYGEMYKNETTVQKPAVTNVGKQVAAQPTGAATTTNWRDDYDYVLRDLRTLLVVSVVLFAVIIIAGFFA
ncbi:MAG: hypothetical protein R2867_28490 [Caldilineaceae bacterium]